MLYLGKDAIAGIMGKWRPYTNHVAWVYYCKITAKNGLQTSHIPVGSGIIFICGYMFFLWC